MEIVGQSQAAGAGNGQSDRLIATIPSHEFLVNVFKQSRHCGAYVGVMTTIVGEEHAIERVGLVEHHGLHRGRTDVKTYTQRLRIAGFDRGICCFNHVYLYTYS